MIGPGAGSWGGLYSLVALFRDRRRRFRLRAVCRRCDHRQASFDRADIVPAGALDMLGVEIARIAAKSDADTTFRFSRGRIAVERECA